MFRQKIKTEALKQGFRKPDGTINVYELAKQSGLQITQLNNYLKGETDLKGCNIEKLFEVLSIGLCCV